MTCAPWRTASAIRPMCFSIIPCLMRATGAVAGSHKVAWINPPRTTRGMMVSSRTRDSVGGTFTRCHDDTPDSPTSKDRSLKQPRALLVSALSPAAGKVRFDRILGLFESGPCLLPIQLNGLDLLGGVVGQ